MNKLNRNEENRKSPVGKLHSNYCCRQDPLMDGHEWVKARGETEYSQFQNSSHKVSVNYKEKNCDLIVEKYADITLSR